MELLREMDVARTVWAPGEFVLIVLGNLSKSDLANATVPWLDMNRYNVLSNSTINN